MPGSLRRFGPAQATGETRFDHTGSTRMLSPAVWISQLAWPTNDSRTLSPSTRGGGVSACGLGAHSGQLGAAGRGRIASAAPHPAISAARPRDRRNARRRNDRRPARHRFSCVNPEEGTPSTAAPASAENTAGAFHARLASKACFGKGEPTRKASRNCHLAATFLDFSGLRGFNAATPRKDVLFDPPPGP